MHQLSSAHPFVTQFHTSTKILLNFQSNLNSTIQVANDAYHAMTSNITEPRVSPRA